MGNRRCSGSKDLDKKLETVMFLRQLGRVQAAI